MSKLTSTTQKKLLATAVIVTIGGVAAAVSAAPTLFDATATVQTAVTISEVTPLNFGTVFITNSAAVSSAASSSTVAAAAANKLTLAPAGGVTAGTLVTGAPMLTLGGATVGSYNIPGLPASSKIGLDITNGSVGAADFANAPTSADGSCGYDSPSDALTGGKIVLSIAGGDPATTGFFCLDALTATNTSGAINITSTFLPTGTAAASPVATDATGYTLPFGATSLTFNLGGTLVQQVPRTGSQRSYQAGAYEGQIGMEVFFK